MDAWMGWASLVSRLVVPVGVALLIWRWFIGLESEFWVTARSLYDTSGDDDHPSTVDFMQSAD